MTGRRFSRAVLAPLAFWALTAHAVQPVAPVVRSAAQFKAAASSQGTPLDAFTPYGKRRFVGGVSWSERGITGFNGAMLVRELQPEQVEAVLVFIGAGEYAPAYIKELTGPPLHLPGPTAYTEARLAQLWRFKAEEDWRRNDADGAITSVATQRLERRFGTLFGERMSATTLRALPLGDLPVYFEAAELVSQGKPASTAARHLALVYAELRRRGIDTRRYFDARMLGQLLEARKYEEARVFVAGKPHLAATVIPNVRDPLGPAFRGRSVYRYDAASRSLTREALPRAAGPELVMVVNAGCGFSARALAALQEDPAMRARMQEAGLVLIIPPRSPIPFDFVDEWNRANPTIPMGIPYSVQEWQAVDVADVPRFFVLKEGKVVGQVTGWPLEGNKAALLALLDGAAN